LQAIKNKQNLYLLRLEMKINLKNKHLRNVIYALLFVGIAFSFQPLFQQMVEETNPQTSAWFGTGSDEFEPYVEKTSEEKLRSWIHYALILVGALVILVLGYVFDIAAFAQKLTGRKIANANNINAFLLMAFLIVGMGFVVWEFYEHGKHTKVYNSSSEHGVDYDNMFLITLILTGIVFVITQVALFGYSFKYRSSEKRKATYYSHNNKLEIFWTIIPAIVLTVLVLKGYSAWSYMMYDSEEKSKAKEIEVYAYQFGWTARYPGADGKFGGHSFNYISGTNDMGLAVESEVEKLKEELRTDTTDINRKLENQGALISELSTQAEALKRKGDFKGAKEIEKEINEIKSGGYEAELKSAFRRKSKQLERMAAIENNPEERKALFNGAVHDDIVAKQIVLIKGEPIKLKFRARDVIHSAFIPDFRVQMNCVPGMSTEFTFTPTKTTDEIRKEKGDEEYDYYLFCNKICGQAHFNMKIKVIVVESKKEYFDWLITQKPAYPVALPNTTEEVEEEVETPTEL
jgi:cytochrome c oxidase subunit II